MGSGLAWTLPSFRDLIFLAVFLSLTLGALAPRLFRDGGTGWHVRTGQIILSSHAIPRIDPFSVSSTGKTWYAWEWLADVAMGATFQSAGLYGVSFLAALIIAATFAMLFTMLRQRHTGLFLSVVLVLLAISGSTIHMFARPHVASWLLMLLWLRILESARETGRYRRLFWLPAVMLIWVNLHGGFLLGFVLLAIYWCDTKWVDSEDARLGHSNGERMLSYVTLASAFTSLINPFGYRIYTHIYQYLGDSFLMNHIQEFQSPNFHGAAERCFLALVLLAVLGIAVSQRTLTARHLLILLFAIYAGVFASRNIPTSSMLIALVIGPLLSSTLQRDRSQSTIPSTLGRILTLQDRVAQTDEKVRHGLWIAVGVALLLCVTFRGGTLGPVRMAAQFEPARFPVEAVNFIQSQRITDPVFSIDQWGGYLVFRLYPAKVMVDDRHDLYGAQFFQRYLDIVRVQPGWMQDLQSMNAQLILVPSNSSLAGALESIPGWDVEYHDETAVLFRRSIN